MDEYQNEPPTKPVLRPHRLIPARPGIVPDDGLPVAEIEQQVESWLEVSNEIPTPGLAEGGRALAEQAWLFIEKAALTLDGLPAVFRAAQAPDAALQALELISSILLAFPDLMASGLETNVARVDWMFSRLINAPGHPGLVELIIEALDMLDAGGAEPEPPADHSAEIEILRGLHRDLVTLQQRWDELIEKVFPVVFPPPARPWPESESRTEPVGISIGARAGQSLPTPAGLMLAQNTSGASTARAFRSRIVGKQQQRLAMLLVLALLVVAVIGILLAEARSGPALTPGNAALSVLQRSPTPATSQTSTLTPALPTPTPTRPAPTPQPPTPTPPSDICPVGSVFCVSTAQLQVPCAGQGDATFQLISSTGHDETWQAISLPGGSLVTISPAAGALKGNQTVTLSVRANTSVAHKGMILIEGPDHAAPVIIAVQVCHA